MKQFWTICLSVAMSVGTALSANATITLEQAMQMHKEGKAFKSRSGVKKFSDSMKPVKQAPVSRFHKMMSSKAGNAKKAPQKIMANGDNIYGYLAYSSDQSMRVGAYELSANGDPIKMWENDLYYELLAAPSGFGYSDGVLKGYSVASLYGYIFGVYYEEVDANTGEVLVFEQQSDSNYSYFETVVYDPENKQFIGHGLMDDEFVCMTAPEDDVFNYTAVCPVEYDKLCLGLTYNPVEKAVFGVNKSQELVKFLPDGSQEVIMNLDVPDVAGYLSGFVYDAITDLYYWSYVRYDYSSVVATINTKTKELNIIRDIADTQQFSVLFTPDQPISQEAPKRPSAGTDAAKFYKNSSTGYVTYTMPKETGNGNAITEASVGYRTYLDGKLYSTGAAAPGEEVKANFAVEPDQMHKFGMTAVLNGVEGAAMNVMAYVGNDTPLAPTNVVLTESGISWDAVTSGVHGGYVDVSAMTYEVYLNGELVGTTDQTSLAHAFDPEVEFQSYAAEVVASCNGLTSSSTYSNSIATGKALDLPQYLDPTEDQFKLCTVVDNNDDTRTWNYDSDYFDDAGDFYTDYSAPGVQMDDWLFLPKMNFESAEKFYSLSFEVCLRDNQYQNEYVEVHLCKDPNPDSVVLTDVVKEFSPEGTEYGLVTAEFKVPEPGAYFIAVHCTSDGDQYGIKTRNFAIEDNNILLESPVAVEDLSAEAGANGAPFALVSFTMPTKTMGGDEIPATKELKATISSSEADVVVSGKPGEEMSVEVEASLGRSVLEVMVSNDELNSPVARVSVKCGYDVPSSVSEVRGSTSENMLNLNLEWDPVTTGWIDEDDEYGGEIDPSKVTYDIYMVMNGGWELYDTGVTETSYTFSVEPGTPQNVYWLGVVACNDTGDNGYLQYTNGILGDPMNLPLGDDFDSEELSEDLWLTYDDIGAPQFGIDYTKNISDAYADRETSCFLAMGDEYYPGEVGRYGSPRFSTKGEKNVTVTLDVCGDFTLPNTTILAETFGVEQEVVGEITCTEPGFHKVSVSLPEKFLDKNWVGIYLRFEFPTGTEIFAMESITISGSSGVRTIDMSGVKIAGGKSQIKVSGLQNQSVIVSSADGRVAAKSDKVCGDATFNLEKGIYVVKAGNKNAKVVVR